MDTSADPQGALLAAARAVLALELGGEGCTAERDEAVNVLTRLEEVSGRHKADWMKAYIAEAQSQYPNGGDYPEICEGAFYCYRNYCHVSGEEAARRGYHGSGLEPAPVLYLWRAAEAFESCCEDLGDDLADLGFDPLQESVDELRLAVAAIDAAALPSASDAAAGVLDERHLRPMAWRPL